MKPEIRDKIFQLCVNGLMCGEEHHKQWYIEEILKKLDYNLDKISGIIIDMNALGEEPDDYESNEKMREFPYPERERSRNGLNEDLGYGYIDRDPLSNIEFALHELERLKPSEIDDIYLKKRVKAYLKYCQEIAEVSTSCAFKECLIITSDKMEQFLKNFKEYYKKASWRKIAAAIKALEKNGQLKPVAQIVLCKAVIDLFSPDRTAVPEAIGKYIRENSVRISPDEVQEEGYQIAGFFA